MMLRRYHDKKEVAEDTKAPVKVTETSVEVEVAEAEEKEVKVDQKKNNRRQTAKQGEK
ncbi:hypothetical protein [Psychrobacillus sp. BM2]|uniref:hypothetical protein n=1 Tax=Psychrobacillus sp. BM2 TaxID=3400421 RepID=UPI003B0229E9